MAHKGKGKTKSLNAEDSALLRAFFRKEYREHLAVLSKDELESRRYVIIDKFRKPGRTD